MVGSMIRRGGLPTFPTYFILNFSFSFQCQPTEIWMVRYWVSLIPDKEMNEGEVEKRRAHLNRSLIRCLRLLTPLNTLYYRLGMFSRWIACIVLLAFAFSLQVICPIVDPELS